MLNINYLVEINEFYDWLETNQIPKSAIALWNALMHINNKTRWENTFTVAISTIESKTGFKRSELYEARNILAQKGRVKWEQRGGNLCAKYQILFFSVRNTDASVDTNTDTKANTVPDTNPTQMPTISKLNNTQTKQNNSKSHSGKPAKEKSELPYWKNFISEWHSWYEKSKGEKYQYLQKDFAHLKKIYKFLEKRAAEKKFEFTEENLLAAFKFFLDKAWNKDQWLRNNFSIPNILSQFNQIVNEQGKSTGKNGSEPTGAAVSTGSILSKIASMPDTA